MSSVSKALAMQSAVMSSPSGASTTSRKDMVISLPAFTIDSIDNNFFNIRNDSGMLIYQARLSQRQMGQICILSSS